VLGEPVLDGVAAEPTAGGEQQLAWLAVPLGHPGAERRGSSGGQRGAPLLAALAGGGDVRPGAEVNSDQHQSRRASV
jgi:hypothetical protein